VYRKFIEEQKRKTKEKNKWLDLVNRYN
jgi:hypothetical protein